jgi:DNA-binding transcriptional regulator YiaG
MIIGPLTLAAAQSRRLLLTTIADAIEAAPPRTDDQFADAVKAVVQAGILTIEIARMLEVTTPTVTRWGQGTLRPRTAALHIHVGRLVRLVRRHADLVGDGIEAAGIRTAPRMEVAA